MAISNAQFVGLGLVAAAVAGALVFLWYVPPKVSAIFRPPLRTAMYWFIAILLIQTGFILIGG